VQAYAFCVYAVCAYTCLCKKRRGKAPRKAVGWKSSISYMHTYACIDIDFSMHAFEYICMHAFCRNEGSAEVEETDTRQTCETDTRQTCETDMKQTCATDTRQASETDMRQTRETDISAEGVAAQHAALVGGDATGHDDVDDVGSRHDDGEPPPEHPSMNHACICWLCAFCWWFCTEEHQREVLERRAGAHVQHVCMGGRVRTTSDEMYMYDTYINRLLHTCALI
jgi:hypothetical protein